MVGGATFRKGFRTRRETDAPPKVKAANLWKELIENLIYLFLVVGVKFISLKIGSNCMVVT